MNWISYIMYALILTTLTGSVWTVLWCVACVLLKRSGNTKWIYRLLKFAMTGYLIPVVFLLLLVYYRLSDSITGFLFQMTPGAEVVLLMVFGVWAAGLTVCGFIYIPKLVLFRGICRNHIPVSRDINAMVKELCREMGVKVPVRICQGYTVMVPFICGIRRPRIFLPIGSYSQMELKMILTHELIHYQQQDVFWKPVFVAVCCMHWFNPLVWFAARQFQKWSEASCDWDCCENRYSSKEYFRMIYTMADTPFGLVRTFAPTWLTGKNELTWRVKIMKKNQGKKQKKWVAAVIATGAVLMSTVCTFGAEAGLRQMYTSYYVETAPAMEETYIPVEELPSYTAEEQIGSLADFEGMEVVQEDGELLARAGIINWTVTDKMVKQTSQFDKSIEDTITVSVFIDPSDKNVRVGILEPDGRLRYITGSGWVVHTFTVEKDGKHRVYIYNNSGVTVTATGSYN